jgi:hypothetical protein
MNNKSSFLSNVWKYYSGLLDVAVYISSFFFLCWLLAVLFFKSGEFFENFLYIIFIFSILFLILLTLYSCFSERNEKVKTIGNLLGKFFPFIGSFFVLFLFFNLYFPIYPPLKEYFSDFWKIIESGLNEFVIDLLIIFIFFTIPVGIAYQIFIFEPTRRIKDKKKADIFSIIGGLLVIGVEVGLIYWVGFLIYQQSFLSSFIKSNLKLIFGFSLFFIHLNFIIRKVSEFFKRFSKVGSP